MKPSSLIKDGKSDVAYYGDDFIHNRVTAVTTFRTSQGEHKVWMRFSLQIVDSMGDNELTNMMIAKLNDFVRRDLFGRAFNMVKRLKTKPVRSGYWEANLIHSGKRPAKSLESFLNDF